jgi:fructokinase
MPEPFTVVGVGELLWDLFPDGRRLGGAPANVAFHATALGDRGMVASVVGTDALGDEALGLLARSGVDTALVQRSVTRRTGTARVVRRETEPEFEIDAEAAWAAPVWSESWAGVFCAASAITYGTLLCTSATGREVLAQAVATAPEQCLRVCDLNLRPPLDSAEAVEAALGHATVVKLSAAEADRLAAELGQPDPVGWLLDERGVLVVAVTRGAAGCCVCRCGERVSRAAVALDAPGGDPVGAGDAFTAALVHHLVRGHRLGAAAAAANRYAAFVASCRGAMPAIPDAVRREVVAAAEQ